MRRRVYTPWWMKIENWFRRYVFRMSTVRGIMVIEPGEAPRFAPKFEKRP